MDWVCWMWSLVSKMDFKNITPYGLVEYSHSETCAKPRHTHQKNGHLLQDGVCHKIFGSFHWRTIRMAR